MCVSSCEPFSWLQSQENKISNYGSDDRCAVPFLVQYQWYTIPPCIFSRILVWLFIYFAILVRLILPTKAFLFYHWFHSYSSKLLYCTVFWHFGVKSGFELPVLNLMVKGLHILLLAINLPFALDANNIHLWLACCLFLSFFIFYFILFIYLRKACFPGLPLLSKYCSLFFGSVFVQWMCKGFEIAVR